MNAGAGNRGGNAASISYGICTSNGAGAGSDAGTDAAAGAAVNQKR